MDTVQLSDEPVLRDRDAHRATYEYALAAPVTLHGLRKTMTVKLALPSVNGRRRTVRVVFKPETRTGFGGDWALRGLPWEERRNPDGRWMLRLNCDADTANGDVTVTGVTVFRTPA